MITFLSNNAKAVFISEKGFIHPNFTAHKFAEEIHYKGWASNYLVKQQEIENEHKVSTRRWKVIKCKNCIYVNVLDTFCNDGWCSPIDETGTVPLLRDNHHLSLFGSYKLSKNIKKNVKKMFDFIERSTSTALF
uniref:SGNH domain-containing protein n=1 Tax=Panagrolaimus superbus TaxID=310955 RepID=A0A914Y384_9BILA